ncbi:hypothetical protein JNB_06079 [Janibacter sp. HTCC2649]|nr:hypothetical protein JNB_06079 [Janibacter sp. HTCC2649]
MGAPRRMLEITSTQAWRPHAELAGPGRAERSGRDFLGEG